MNEATIQKFSEGLAHIKANPFTKERFGFATTGARVLNLLHTIGVRVTVQTHTEWAEVGSSTYFVLPEELARAAEEFGLNRWPRCKPLLDSKVVTDAAKKFHGSETSEGKTVEGDLYQSTEREISRILYS